MIGHARFLWFAVFLSLLLLTPPILGGEDRAQLVATARDGNRAAIRSIATLRCKYERRPWANTTLEQAKGYFHLFSPGRFWQAGDVYRQLNPRPDGTTLDCIARNGRGLFLHKGGPLPHPKLAITTLSPVDGVGRDMWEWLLFSHWGWVHPGASFYPFYDILDHSHVIRTAERLPPPDNTIHIDLTHAAGRLEFWFDPKVNYLIRKSVWIHAENKTMRWEHEVVEFLEGAPGVFVPIIIEHRCFVKETLQAVLRTILSDVEVNKPLDKDALRLPGIEGMECIDTDREVKYKVDADGKPVGPESPLPVYRVSPPSHSGGSPISGSSRQPSRPPTPGWVWILIFSAIVLVGALIMAIDRRRKQAG